MPLVYVYRPDALARDLADPETQAFLTPLGYTDFSYQAALSQLAKRLHQYDGFPHEIGLFLSYPLDDVKSFVQFGSQCASSQGTGVCSTTRSRRRSALQRTTTAGRYVSPVIGKGSLLKRWPAQSDRRKEMHISESCDCILERHW